MKYLLSLIFIFSINIVNADENFNYSPRVEAAFEGFFGSSIYKTGANIEGVRISGEKISDRPKYGMPITLSFDVDKVEKVLLLNAGGNSYSYNGFYIEKCAKEPVTIFSYNVKDKKYPKELKVNIRTECNQHQITLLLWVKTTSGLFYYDSFLFNTKTNH